MNLASNLSTSARIYPDRAAVRLGDAVTTYTELDERSALVAGLLSRRGLRPGDRVGIMLPNIPDFAALYYGVLRAGGVVVPLNPHAQGPGGRLLPVRLRCCSDVRVRGRHAPRPGPAPTGPARTSSR